MADKPDHWRPRLQIGELLLDAGLTLVPYVPGTWRSKRAGKSPLAHPEGGRIEVTRLDHLKGWLRFVPNMNLAVLGVAQVDADDEPSARLCKELGVSSDHAVWIVRTRRGLRALYRLPDRKLVNVTKNGAPDADPLIELDLLAHSPALIPPSIHPSGFAYSWVRGHSPFDLPYDQLIEPPSLLIDHWQNITKREPRAPAPGPAQSGQFEAVMRSWLARFTRHGQLAGENGRGWIDGISCPHVENHPRGDRDPSFGVNFQLGIWKCFSACGAGRLVDLAAHFGIDAPRVRRRAGGRVRASVTANGRNV